MTEAQKTKRTETFRTAAVLFQDSIYGYPERPGTVRSTIRGTRVG